MHSFRQYLIPQSKRWKEIILKRKFSNALIKLSDLEEKKNFLFSLEQKRQLEEIGRVEKIHVHVSGPPEDVDLEMNKDLSTPYDCCKHISLHLCQRSPLALVNNKILWDMHRPLPGDCTLKFLSFKDKDPFSLNEAFWRTGSFVLGAVILRSFKEETNALLHKFPNPLVSSGSFIYDVKMNLDDWIPTINELKILSGEFLSFVSQNHKIEALKLKKSLAVEIFEENPYKRAQLQEIARENNDNLVTLYRVGSHIDLSTGPMIANTSFFGRCTVTAVHKIANFDSEFYRFQGVSLPKGILLNSYAYDIVVERGRRLNEALVPDLITFCQPSIDSIKESNTTVSDNIYNQPPLKLTS